MREGFAVDPKWIPKANMKTIGQATK